MILSPTAKRTEMFLLQKKRFRLMSLPLSKRTNSSLEVTQGKQQALILSFLGVNRFHLLVEMSQDYH